MKTGFMNWLPWFAPRPKPKPKDSWEMGSGSSWWPIIGTTVTPAGVRVSEQTALSFTAVQAGIRAISETTATLPLFMLEQTDERTVRKATDKPLFSVLHDVPNPEMDAMQFFDSQTAFLVGWGNCYAEIVRDFGGNIAQLWPIHPSRIPLRNITRNETNERYFDRIVAGQPGEIVYYISNEDGTLTPIPASSMLHVAGVLSQNGVTGQGLIRLAADAIGIGMATEQHAGAFFKNGACPNIAIKHPKNVGKETADRLRQQWQNMFGGTRNAYKALILEEGMTAEPFFISPEDSQLLMARQFSVTEISRLLRLPPHMLADLSRSTNNNVEQQAQEFISYSLQPWILRWEKALLRQLLTPEERQKYRFKFNMNSLLRGDSASRAAFYRVMWEMGVFSPNDVLELEDRNPVPGGDVRRLQGETTPKNDTRHATSVNGSRAASNGRTERFLEHSN